MKVWMRTILRLAVVMGTAELAFASPQGAQAVLDDYNRDMNTWRLQLSEANDLESMRAAMAAKPKADAYRGRMIKEVGTSFSKEWTMPYSIWLLEHGELGKKDTTFVFDFVEKYHFESKHLARFCYATVYANKSVQEKKLFLDKAIKHIKNPKDKGLADLSMAVVLGALGDTPLNNARRLQLVRNAIIESAEVKLQQSTVGDLAMEEVYRIQKLSKGRSAPDFVGKDSSGREIKLSDHKGKVVMLVFWSSWDVDKKMTQNLLNVMKKTQEDYKNDPFTMIGVNRDWITNLRELEKSGLVTGITVTDANEKIFRDYRITAPPVCFIIDKEGIIQYQGDLGTFANLTVYSVLNPEPKLKKPTAVRP